LKELESILQNLAKKPSDDKHDEKTDAELHEGQPFTKFLQEQGYIRDKKNWLTNKGFFEIGLKVLREVMSNINSGEFGLHETNSVGMGSVVNDTTKKFEFGSDLKLLSVQQTLLNSVLRLSKSGRKVSFPISIEADDFEEFETLDDVKVAVVYCIDLSSTMRTTLGKTGKSRIQAAKKALWGLYVLNKKFFPNDSIHVVGFGSMASIINPFDIPFLQTYTANDNFLHYTNYQSAFRLARKILQKSSAQNKRIVLITDGQPSACFVDNDIQKNNGTWKYRTENDCTYR